MVVSSIELAELQQAHARCAAQAAWRARPKARREGVDPALNPVEQAIAETWRELLGVDESAAQDDFFALGGHSLAAIRLFARIRKQFAVDLPLATLFETPTLAALAALVAQRGGLDTADPPVADPQEGRLRT